MKKSSAVKAFGSVAALATAFGVTRQAIYKLPEDLPEQTADRVRGAAIRLGLSVDWESLDAANDIDQEAA